ncbi:MAG: YebC/PmpR family DNA-binding transcriptional regulator [Nitriliruptoraceae bacterium]
MSGHSKWANIKHRKAAQDKKRGKHFGKLIRAIESAARDAGTADPGASPSLALAVQKAKDADVPKDNIERACKRGAGELDGAAAYETALYEGYAPGGVAVLVECLTDNRNRTASDVRNAFGKVGGNLAEPGAVAFLFGRRGQVLLSGDTDEDDIMVAGLEAGLDDVEIDGQHVVAWCDPSAVSELRTALESAGLDVRESGSTMVASTMVELSELEDARKVLALLDALDDNDDVQEVYANAAFDNVLEDLDE